MPENIAPGVLYLTREDWGADESLPRLGAPAPPLQATELIEHHTTQKDTDQTPNIFETVAEAVVKMRQLQTVRPDLGDDVPYSWVRALMAYPNGARGIVLMEGRGAYRRGAHTMYHNRTGRATATLGNFMLPTEVLPYVPMINQGWGWLKQEFGLANMGTVSPPGSRVAFMHRDFRDPEDTRTWTVCPGDSMADVITLIRPELYEPIVPPEEEDFMLKLYHVKAPGDFFRVCLSDGVSQSYVFNGTTLRERQEAGELPTEVFAVLTGEEATKFLNRPAGPGLL